MKINISEIDLDNFIIKQENNLLLITPNHINCKWDKHNLHFRSSIWDVKTEELVSAGLPKFFNYGEHPEITPPPIFLQGCEIISKIDGSLLVLSPYKEELIIRTRGTFDATKLDNGHEIEILKKKYPKVFKITQELHDYSVLLEWYSPVNKIVLNYGDEPKLWLVGAVDHRDYGLVTQTALDLWAVDMEVERPKRWVFNTTEQLLESIKELKGEEGVCLYYNNGQNILKVKSDFYRTLHALKSNLTTDKLADMWFIWGQQDFSDYQKKFLETFDFECWEFARPAVSSLFDGIKEYKKIVDHITTKTKERASWTRKDFAIKTQEEYGSTKKFTLAMNTYLGKKVDQDVLKHILLQNTKQVELKMFNKKQMEEDDEA